MRILRIILGFALSPLASGVLQIFVMDRLGGFRIIIISYPFAFILGIPGFFIARYLCWLSLRAVLLGGAGLGVLVGLLIALEGLHDNPISIILGFSLFAAHGAVVAGLFWVIALWRCKER